MNYKDKSTVIKSEFYQRIAQVCGYSKTTVRDVFSAAYELAVDELKDGIPVVIGDFGVLERSVAVRTGGYNFYTKERYPAKKSARVKFTPNEPFKRVISDSINSNI